MRRLEQDPKDALDLKAQTIAELAEILNLAESTLYGLLRGHRFPNFVTDWVRDKRSGAAKSRALPETRDETRVRSRKG
jgi:hypothetical protein